jgi:sodium/proline symporter
VGGFVSVAWVDLFQAVFLLGAVIIVPCVAFSKIEGVASISAAARAQSIPMTFIPDSLEDILYPALGWGLGYFGMPHIITKFMGIQDPKELTKSKYLGISWQICALAAASAVGIIGIAYFQNKELADAQLVYVQMVDDLFHPFVAGILLCGVMAATISTMDSQILVAASTASEDIYKQLFQKNATSKQEVKAFRFAVIFIAAIAFWISMSRSATIMDTVYYAWAGLGATFAPLVLASLYSKYVTRQGAITGIITGGVIALSWPTITKVLGITGAISSYSMIPGFVLSLTAIFLVSSLTQKPRIQ